MLDFFKMADNELAELLSGVRTEMKRRLDALQTDSASIIRGAECQKRAIVVAAAGEHTLLFIGPHNSGKTMLRAVAHELGVISFEVLPCPCGNLQSPLRSCTCSEAEIKSHQATITPCEINIETQAPSQRELESTYRGTTVEDLANVVASKSKCRDLKLDSFGESLLRTACIELALDPNARQTIIAVARTIANLDGKTYIESSHIAEACNYRALLRK